MRVRVWSIGDAWGLTGSEDGQAAHRPEFSGSQPSCGSDLHCTGGTGRVSFPLRRSDTTTVPPAEWRNMMVLQKPTTPGGYAFEYALADNQAYDVRFQTVYKYRPDAKGVSSILWEVGGGENALGVVNDIGTGNRFFYNPNNTAQWHSEVLHYGRVDTWEIQMLWTHAATGWTDVYRNGTKVFHYTGAVKPYADCNHPNCFTAFGMYYYRWNDAARLSTVKDQNVTFNYFVLDKIPGPVPPALP